MRHWVLLLVLAVSVAVIAYLAVWVFTGNDHGLDPEEPDGRAVPLPGTRPLVESDISAVRFDTGARGYRMVQVDAALRRAAYDIGYKQELIDVLDAEVVALRDGRFEDADALRRARRSALEGTGTTVTTSSLAGRGAGKEDLQGAASFADVADPADDGAAATSEQSDGAGDGHVERDGSAVGERAASGR
jgi:DivIVA domain-containing protein